MKKFFLIVIACLMCAACGVKDNPEYKSQKNYNKILYLI